MEGLFLDATSCISLSITSVVKSAYDLSGSSGWVLPPVSVALSNQEYF